VREEMVFVIKEEDADKVIRALNLKRGIREVEKEIAGLMEKKRRLEEEYAKLGVSIE